MTDELDDFTAQLNRAENENQAVEKAEADAIAS